MGNDDATSRVELLQGTFDMLMLRTLLRGPAHGYAIAKHIQRTSEDLFQVETGSSYPALRRLETKSWITASWEWEAFSRAMTLILNPIDQEAQ